MLLLTEPAPFAFFQVLFYAVWCSMEKLRGMNFGWNVCAMITGVAHLKGEGEKKKRLSGIIKVLNS